MSILSVTRHPWSRDVPNPQRSFRFPSDLSAHIERIANEREISVSEFMRQAAMAAVVDHAQADRDSRRLRQPTAA